MKPQFTATVAYQMEMDMLEVGTSWRKVVDDVGDFG